MILTVAISLIIPMHFGVNSEQWSLSISTLYIAVCGHMGNRGEQKNEERGRGRGKKETLHKQVSMTIASEQNQLY